MDSNKIENEISNLKSEIKDLKDSLRIANSRSRSALRILGRNFTDSAMENFHKAKNTTNKELKDMYLFKHFMQLTNYFDFVFSEIVEETDVSTISFADFIEEYKNLKITLPDNYVLSIKRCLNYSKIKNKYVHERFIVMWNKLKKEYGDNFVNDIIKKELSRLDVERCNQKNDEITRLVYKLMMERLEETKKTVDEISNSVHIKTEQIETERLQEFIKGSLSLRFNENELESTIDLENVVTDDTSRNFNLNLKNNFNTNPEDNKRLCDSRTWWPTIRKLAEEFEIELKKKKENAGLVQLNMSNLDSAFEIYEQSWWKFKQHVYSENAEKHHIDRHKITSLYILSILIAKPFFVFSNPKKGVKDKSIFLVNELFSLAIMQLLISAWTEKYSNFMMKENEKKWIVILLNHLKLKLEKSNVSDITDDYNILSLAQIIYYIEKSYVEDFEDEK